MTKPHWAVVEGDCLQVMRGLPAGYFSAVVTDPPYGFSKEPDVAEVMSHWIAGDKYEHGGGGFMGKTWDSFVPGPEYWREAYRVMKPGAYLLAFCGTRTWDLMSVAIRFAGFENRDTIRADTGPPALGWLYGSGFPKSLNVGKAIDDAAGVEREVVGTKHVSRRLNPEDVREHNYSVGTIGAGADISVTAPTTDAAKQWDGWGTALKPAWEVILVFRKPLNGTVAANVQEHGTGAINVDACRVAFANKEEEEESKSKNRHSEYESNLTRKNITYQSMAGEREDYDPPGRWPANVVLAHAEDCCEETECAPGCPVAELDAQSGILKSGALDRSKITASNLLYGSAPKELRGTYAANVGGASRFFYTAKTSTKEREAGLDGFPVKTGGELTDRQDGTNGLNSPRAGAGRRGGRRNTHPTVKPLALMRWLVKLVTPPDGVVLDPFAGSGSTGCAAALEGRHFMGIELEAESAAIARARIAHWATSCAPTAPPAGPLAGLANAARHRKSGT